MATYEYNVDSSWPGPGSPGTSVWHFRQANNLSSIQQVVDVIHDFHTGVIAAGLLPNGFAYEGRPYVLDVTDRSETEVDPWSEGASGGDDLFAGPLMLTVSLRTASMRP